MSAVNLDALFDALADGTRRGVVGLLRQGPLRAGEIGEALGVSAQALSRHLRVLRSSGMIEQAPAKDDARARVFRLRREPFSRLARWAAEMEELWSEQLQAFAQLANKPGKRSS